MQFEGIYDDGWLRQISQVSLQGGGPADLVLRAHVLPCPDQHLEIRVNGTVIASRPVEAGALDLRFPIKASPTERRVELRWAATSPLNDSDAREGAALLRFLDVTDDKLPPGLRIPGGLAHPGAQHHGIHADGWSEQEAWVALAGGGPASLVVRGSVPQSLPAQRLELALNGAHVFAGPVFPGPFDIRTDAPAVDSPRRVELRWRDTAPVSGNDPRHAAALLAFVGVTSGLAPTMLRNFPTDIADPNVRQTGIHRDGWVAGRTEVTLARGPAAELVIRAQTPDGLDEQRLTIFVDGDEVGTATAAHGTVDARVPLAAAEGDRLIELVWDHTTPLSAADERAVSARLSHIGLASGRVPNAVARFPSDLADPNLVSSGIHPDGWSTQESSVVLAGDSVADLIVQARIPDGLHEQELDVQVDGVPFASARAVRGVVNLRAPLPPSEAARQIVLRWGSEVPVSSDDPRPASALIDMIAVLPRLSL